MYTPKAKIRSPENSTSRIIGTLHVAIHQAKDLPAMDEHGLTDATVKLYLLPNQSSSGKRKTKVINQNLNPAWDEQITYENVYMNDLSSRRVLEVTIWDYDRRGSNDFIGGLRIGPRPDSVAHTDRVKDWMDSTGEEVNHWEAMLERPGEWVEQWHDLRPKMKVSSTQTKETTIAIEKALSGKLEDRTAGLGQEGQKGEYAILEVVTMYKHIHVDKTVHGNLYNIIIVIINLNNLQDPTKVRGPSNTCKGDYDITGDVLVGVYYKNSELNVHVDRARGLAAGDSNGYSDPYIKIYLLPDREKHTKRKTSVKKKTLDPVYNETFKVRPFYYCFKLHS